MNTSPENPTHCKRSTWTLRRWAASRNLYVVVCLTISEGVPRSFRGSKSPIMDLEFLWVPLGQQPAFRLLLLSIDSMFSCLGWWTFYSIQCQIMDIGGKWKPLWHPFSLEHTPRTFWWLCFSFFLLLAVPLWPPLSPECCCSIRSGLLLIAPRPLRKSGRCN